MESNGNESVRDKVRRALTYHPLTSHQKRLFRYLYAADGRFVSHRELMDALDLTDNQLNGVLGNIGKRGSIQGVNGLGFSLPMELLVAYKGVPTDYSYRLQDDARMVLEQEGLV